MKYLFFDIECSNCFQGVPKMCEFGYVLADESFNVIEKNVILMSPGKREQRSSRFDTGIFKREPDFKWFYDEDTYFNSKPFINHYKKIKRLLEDKDTIVFGYSIDNDINYINVACFRYKLSPIEYIGYDIQRLVSLVNADNKSMKLSVAYETLCNNLEIDTIQKHLSCDDAYMSMRVLEKLVSITHKTIRELTGGYRFYKRSSLDAYDKFVKKYEYNHSPERLELLKSQQIYRSVVGSFKNKFNDPIYKDKRISISPSLRQSRKELQELISYLNRYGYAVVSSNKDADILVVRDTTEKTNLSKVLDGVFKGKYIYYQDFINKK